MGRLRPLSALPPPIAVLMPTRSLRSLVSRARSPRADDDEIRVFKAELRQALTDPSQLPAGELDDAVEYDDGSDEKFLRRLWHDLYGAASIVGS